MERFVAYSKYDNKSSTKRVRMLDTGLRALTIFADSRQQTADSRQQTADSRQQTADSRQQTADSRQQTADSRQQTADSLGAFRTNHFSSNNTRIFQGREETFSDKSFLPPLRTLRTGILKGVVHPIVAR